jgi:hypothetical protein
MISIQESLITYLINSFYMNPKSLLTHKKFSKDLRMSQCEINEVVAYIENQLGINLPNVINTDELSIAQLCEWAFQVQKSSSL